jgi:hypothetical protein
VELPLHYARLLPRILGLTFVKAVHDLGRDLAKGVKDRVLQVSWFLRGLAPPDEPFVPAPVPAEDPDRLVQLSLVLVSPIRSGPTGLRLVELALRLVNARLERYLIGLNEIQTIHCARWLLYSPSPREGRPREHFLLFVATYDNSWEDYIDAFVDNAKVRKFLVAIWRNTEGFPKLSPPLPFVRRRPFVEPFKRWIRGIEVPTGVMYSAALHGPPAPQPVSVLNLHSALLLRELLASRSNAVPWARTRRAEVRALTAFLSGGVCPVGRSFLPWPSAAWLLLKERVTQGWQRVLARLQPPVGALLAPRRTRDGAGPRHGTGVPEAALPPDAALEVAASGEAWRGHPAPAGGGLPGHAGRRLPVPPH